MKRKLLVAFCLGSAIVACRKDSDTVTTAKSQSVTHKAAGRYYDSTAVSSSFITQSVANQMISSYLSSINSAQNDSDIHSFSVNADSLRAYLENPAIKNVKLMFAHTMNYISAGNTGLNAGYNSGALTIVIAGNDSLGNYIYYRGCVLDHIAPCPYTCDIGYAGGDLLQ